MSLLTVRTLFVIDPNLFADLSGAPTFVLLVEVALGVRDFLGRRVREPVTAVFLTIFAIYRIAFDAGLAGVPWLLFGFRARFLLAA